MLINSVLLGRYETIQCLGLQAEVEHSNEADGLTALIHGTLVSQKSNYATFFPNVPLNILAME